MEKFILGYIPNGKILEISKFARLIDVFARRLQTQEYLTEQIGTAIQKNLHPKGLIVHIQARHLCMDMRGVKKSSITKTTVSKGLLEKRKNLQDQFFRDVQPETVF